MAACLTLAACGGDHVSTGSSSASSPSGPSSPGGGATTGSPTTGTPTGGATPTQANWSAVAALDGQPGEGEPAVTLDAKGNALATWLTAGNSSVDTNEIWGNRYVPGQGWGTPARLDTTDGSVNMTGPSVSPPQVVGNANGQALALWVQWTPGPNVYALWARPFDPSSGWGTPVQVALNVASTTSNDTSASYSAGIDASGNALVVWTEQTPPSSSSIAWRRYTTNGQWSTAAVVPEPAQTGPGAITGSAIQNISPNLAVTSDGNAVLAWQQTDNIQSALWTATYDPASGWSNSNPQVSVADRTSGAVFSPVVGMDDSGNITLVWGETDIVSGAVHTTTMSQRYAAGTGWQGVQPVAPAIALADGGYFPVLTVNSQGSALVAWYGPDGALYANVSDTKGTWGTAQQLSTKPNLGENHPPQLALDDAGNAAVAWSDSATSGSTHILASRYANGTWAAPTLFGTDPQGAFGAAMAGNSSGDLALLYVLDVTVQGSTVTEVQTSFFTPGS
ncbi:hypothetical protein [Paraburkholderia sp. J12]|uniref:hypothetical protein n=1 Tax=Paraburkholderia sp. J12 TaxID=2805432 RepID=UPI002ABE8273|nr:hypothetical protein [Paraburkholderia sp. J12]